MQNLILLLLAALLLMGPGSAAAQPGEEPPPASTGKETAADGEGGDEDTADARPSAEVFIPTEEISEDFAVSFPVDI